MNLNEKKNKLESYLKELGKVAVAYSSGVDSTLLLKVAYDTLGADNVIAVTAVSPFFPKKETTEAVEFCKELGIRHFFVETDEMQIDGFAQNPPDRCYICKKALFSELIAVAKKNGMNCVCEGSNMDDLGDYRPGLKAIAELDVKSPLRYAELYKSEIRKLSKELNLPTWKKQSFACLASRFVYGEYITAEKLGMVEKAEDFLREMHDFTQLRVRIHDKLARIEVAPDELDVIMSKSKEINEYLRSLGFMYVTLDIGGYSMGSMNRALGIES
ncbi:MAG: ATP-dependent sacrificial sulfur transferase LarE [Clostridia bacterium]|nr:ATP-dependent sacrificial sulfur transferase LarE [Clostridia bacterium]